MTTMSYLPSSLEDEILSRIPITSLKSMRSTCKKWNAFSKAQIIGKAAKQSLGFMLRENEIYTFKLSSLSFNLQDEEFDVKIGIKQVSILDHVKIYYIFHCDGLLLCLVEDPSSILVWNPYLAQTKWIQANNYFRKVSLYFLGYDNKRNHKILRILDDDDYESGSKFEIFRFDSNSWKLLNVTPDWDVLNNICDAVSLKGNTYFFVSGEDDDDDENDDNDEDEDEEGELEDRLEFGDFLICFDFTTESFGSYFPLPFSHYVGENVSLSCVREEQLVLLYNAWKTSKTLEVWVSNKIEPDAMSWSMFLIVDTTQLTGFPAKFDVVSFFIDEEKKAVVVFDRCVAHIIGEDGYSKSMNIGYGPDLFCSYVPSLDQLQTKSPGEKEMLRLQNQKKEEQRKIEIMS